MSIVDSEIDHRDTGFTRNELFVAIGVLLLIVGLGLPGIFRRRWQANEARAVSVLEALARAQQTYAHVCGRDGFATTFAALRERNGDLDRLGAATGRTGEEAFDHDGYTFRLSVTPHAGAPRPDCEGRPTAAVFHAEARPLQMWITGRGVFTVGVEGSVTELGAGSTVGLQRPALE